MRVAWLIACFVPKQLASWVDAVAFQYARGKGIAIVVAKLK